MWHYIKNLNSFWATASDTFSFSKTYAKKCHFSSFFTRFVIITKQITGTVNHKYEKVLESLFFLKQDEIDNFVLYIHTCSRYFMRIFIIFKHILKETVPYFFLFKHTREQLYDNNSSEKIWLYFLLHTLFTLMK